MTAPPTPLSPSPEPARQPQDELAQADWITRLGERIERIGNAPVTLVVTLVSIALSAACAVPLLLAWQASMVEWQVLLGLCIVVPTLVSLPISWAIGVLAVEARVAQREAERLAMTDPLTGLCNRRYCLEVAGREFQRSMRSPDPLAVLLLDIDRFKSINDRHGHATGDEVLVRVAQAGLACAHEYDTMARLGGEEFVLLLPGTPLREALAMAERVRAAIAAVTIAVPGAEPIRPTVSIGVAVAIHSDADVAQVLSRADQAMYAAKRGGRDQVAC